MKCPITYQKLMKGEKRYSQTGLRSLSKQLTQLKSFPFSALEARQEALKLATKLSIQGLQPKLSVGLNLKESIFEVREKGGTYILKPQVADLPNMPENEDLTMKLARTVGIPTPWHGLIYCQDESLAYVIKRFDRVGKGGKRPQEDFAQLIGASRATKYEASTERIAEVIEEFCTFQILENLKLFKMILFSFFVGNEDLHLKNLSLTTLAEGKIVLTPAYDLLNSTIVLASSQEELALELNGKKKGFKRDDFTRYLGQEILFLSEKTIKKEISIFSEAIRSWPSVISNSFLPPKEKSRYHSVVLERTQRILGQIEQ